MLLEASWYHPWRRLSDYTEPFIRFILRVSTFTPYFSLFVCHCPYIILIMSKCIFNGNYCFNSQVSVRIHVNYFIGILIPCLVAFEAVFHSQAFPFLPPAILLSTQYQCFSHILSNIKVMKFLFPFSLRLFYL